MSDFEMIVNELSKIESVKAIALSGSASTDCKDELSDYDIYIYTDNEIDLNLRKEIAAKYSKDSELNNRYWETGDEMIIKDEGKIIDIMYRNPNWIEGMIENVWSKHYASVGYTTCFLHNVKSSKILYDKDGWFLELQKKVSTAYPQILADNIIEKNLPLLKEKKYSSFYDQIKKAIERKDYVSLNHRITAFFASYFDVLFALNKIFHPGEKRLVQYVRSKCGTIPANFEQDVNAVLCASEELVLAKINVLLMHLYEVV